MNIIQLQSVPRSGSTVIGLMLGYKRDGRGVCTGDLHDLFKKRPSQWCYCDLAHNNDLSYNMCKNDLEKYDVVSHHIDRENLCEIWQSVYKMGMVNVYETLQKMGFDLVVSTGKQEWFYDLITRPFDAPKNLLVYKHPFNLAYSYYKRRTTQPKLWNDDGGAMNRYGKAYQSLMNNNKHNVVISYEDFVSNPKRSLQIVCDALDIQYFPGKERYWNNPEPHIYGGSPTALMHLFDKDSKAFEEAKSRLSKPKFLEEHYREIYHADHKDELPDKVKVTVRSETQAMLTWQDLERRNIL